MTANDESLTPDQPTHDPIANWQWLANVTHRDRVLIVSNGDVQFARALSSGFARRTVVAAESLVGIGPTAPMPFADGTFDCVALPDAGSFLAAFRDLDAADAAYREIRRVLRADHGRFVGFSYVGKRLGIRMIRRLGRIGRPPQQRILLRNGFSRSRIFYIDPSPQRPTNLVPAERRAVLAWERLTPRGTWTRFIRRVVIRLGLHSLLFEYRFVVANS